MGFWSGYFTAKALSGDSNNNGGCILCVLPFLEVFIISGEFGKSCHSWWVFGGCLLGMLILLSIRPFAMAFSLVMSAAWGYDVYSMMAEFSDDIGARVVLGIIAFFIVLGSHLVALDV